MPDRLRRWWVWLGLVLVGIAGAWLALMWLLRIYEKQNHQPGSAAFLPVAGFVIAVAAFAAGVTQTVIAGLQLRQGSRPALEQPEPEARDELRQHLGRQGRPRRMDEVSPLALDVVRPTISLLPPLGPTAAHAERAIHPRPRLYGFLPQPRRERADGAPSLDRDLPAFVSRDKGREIASWMSRASESGGFLVLCGDSSVGKTRLLYETARQVLPNFVVLVPGTGNGALVNSISKAKLRRPPKLIVWLDELQRFLDGPFLAPGSTRITANAVWRLLGAPTPVVVLGAMWREHARELTKLDPDMPGRYCYPKAADILRDGRVRLEMLKTFSDEERDRAGKLPDPRLKVALDDPVYNVTEVLAGAPQLVARYELASEEQRAVLDAAIDARRLGIHALLPGTLLGALARGYLSTLHPDDSWQDPALAELARPDHATTPLILLLNQEKSEELGYTVADYLEQYGRQQRKELFPRRRSGRRRPRMPRPPIRPRSVRLPAPAAFTRTLLSSSRTPSPAAATRTLALTSSS